MNDNLIFLINKLSHIIVSQAFEDGNDPTKGESSFNKCVKKIKQRGCDVLLKKASGTPVQDPCLTDYGGNWSPIALITDYGRELQAQGGAKYNLLLLNSIKILEEREEDYVNDILKFLLLMKKPLFKETSKVYQKQVSFRESETLLPSIDSDSLVPDSCPKDGLSRASPHKKALQYQESWTKQFDFKFQLLGECSKKNLSTPDKVSLNSIFSSRPLVNASQSRSNSFVFPDFSSARNYRSEKSLFDINNGTYVTDSIFLDSFVDHPISHKLPALSLNSKFSSKHGFLERPSLQITTRFPSFPEEGRAPEISQPCCSISHKTSVIELKRNSNCSHSFAILYEKSARSRASSSNSTDSLPFVNTKMMCPRSTKSNRSPPDSTSPRSLVLALWEQEQTLIKDFRPELSDCFPSLRMINHSEYIEDVKYLFTGINSKTFRYDERENVFSMAYGTCLDDVTPESLFDFSQEFLQIGNCYVKLNMAMSDIGKNNFDSCTTITQAFWKSIADFLELHYALVLDIPFQVNLMALKSCTRDLHQIIMTVANICKVLTPGEALPKGGELLSYLLQFAEKITNQSVMNVVFGILQNCCSVYFTCVLQNWMFKGQLGEEGDGELFVDCRREIVKTKSRTYYGSFYLVDKKIPSFLRGNEESIYNCGKSVHFLKLFNAKDKFCQILDKADYPTMRLCFSQEELNKLESEFKSYEERVIKICGKRVTIKSIRDEEKEKGRAYADYIKECKVLEEEKRELLRMRKLEEAKAAKDRQNQYLNEQWSAIESEKLRRKQDLESRKLHLEMEIKKAEIERENIVNQEKRAMKEYYEQIMADLTKKLKVLEKRKEYLKNIVNGGITPEDLDVINDNCPPTDKDRNINKFDINSNAGSLASEKFIRTVELGQEPEKEPEPIEGESQSSVSVAYDENLNPNQTNEATSGETDKTPEPEPKKVVRKCASYRTVSAEEAKRNKCKILMSEFALPVRKNFSPAQTSQDRELKPTVALSDLDRNIYKVLDSEYNLLQPSNQNSLKRVSRKLQTVKGGDPVDSSLQKDNSSHLPLRSLDFNLVKLQRKSEQMNLDIPSEQKPVSKEPARSDSSDSFLTTSPEMSATNVSNHMSNVCEDVESLQTPTSSSILLNKNYQDALALDTKVFYHKVSHKHIFCCLKEGEVDSLLCTDFMMFQRCLRKSILLPLKIQEKLANDALLKHLLEGENLLSHLRSLWGYFFLNDGEFGRSFTHNTFRSLARCTEPKQFFERSNLSNIVNEALNYTIHNCEPNAQNLSFRIVRMPPYLNHSSHDVLSPFELSYKVHWPLNIILTEKSLAKYKLVFRFLLKLKRINWTLNENFLYLNSYFKNRRLRENLAKSPHYHKIQIYRHAMTQIMITLDDYIFSNGIQYPWIYFLKDLETTENIDHLYQKHVRYIKDVLTRCFLSKNSEDLLECLHNMIELALKFHYTAKSSTMEVVNGSYQHPKFFVLKSTFNEFCSVIKVFLKTLKEKISSNQVLKSHHVLIEKFDLKLT